MKTKEELNALKEEAETLNRKPHELSDEELAQVTGGKFVPYAAPPLIPPSMSPPLYKNLTSEILASAAILSFRTSDRCVPPPTYLAAS